MSDVLRYGILGSGFMGRTHAEAIRNLPNARLSAVACGKRAAQLASEYGATLCTSADELVARADVDAVIVATPQFVHTEQALAATTHGKHLFIEKPMATSVADCDAIIAACAAKGLALSVGYQQRYRTVPRAAHDLLRENVIGQVHTIQLFQVFQLFNDPAFGGDWSWWSNPATVGHILAGGVHGIDFCRWALGAEVTSVVGHARTIRAPAGYEPENTTMGMLTFSNGTIGSLWATSACPPPSFPGLTFRAYLLGETGMLDMDAYDALRVATDGTWRVAAEQPPVNTEYAATAFQQPRMGAYIAQLAAFTNAVLAGTPPPVSGTDGRAGVAVALALLESSRTGSIVRLDA